MDNFPYTEFQLEWLKALEEEEFPQGRGALQEEEGYCCMGVACKIAERKKVYIKRDRSGCIQGGFLSDQPMVFPLLKLRNGRGIPKSNHGGRPTPSNLDSLTFLNDQKGYTFPEIAKVIKENPDDYFNNLDTQK